MTTVAHFYSYPLIYLGQFSENSLSAQIPEWSLQPLHGFGGVRQEVVQSGLWRVSRYPLIYLGQIGCR